MATSRQQAASGILRPAHGIRGFTRRAQRTPSALDVEPRRLHRIRLRFHLVLTSALLLVLGAAVPVAARAQQCPDGTPPPCRAQAPRAPSPNSIAVLYFDNLSRDSADTYIADGLTDEVIVRLQHVPRLDVKSRYEVRRFRGTRIADARSVGRELRVAYLVTGSVRPSPSRMRVSYELVRTSDGRTMASDIVDTTSADPWAISNGVALAIARQVAGRLAPEERAALTRGPSRDAQAVDLYRRGVSLVDRGIRQYRFDVLMSLAFFRAAIERDSTFADPWSSMADAWGWLDNFFPNRFVAERGRAAARRALALDSTSSKAASALAYAMVTVDYDWPGAERVLRRAIALDPRGVEARLVLTEVLGATGRFDEAVRKLDEAWAIDSLNPRFGYYVSLVLASARRIENFRRWADREATLGGRASTFGFCYRLATQHPDSALADTLADAYRVVALSAAGRLPEARDLATRIQADKDSAQGQGSAPVVLESDHEAIMWAAVGDRDRAFAALEQSYRVRSGSLLPFIKYLPFFDNLRDDPRYHDLLRRMHLEP
jgi:TolB-like protein